MYIYSPKRRALELTAALNAVRLKRFDGIDFWSRGERIYLNEGDVIVCWGASLPELDGVRVLNGTDIPIDIFKEFTLFQVAGLAAVRNYRSSYPKMMGFLPRRFDHVGGNDLASPPLKIDYFSLKEEFIEEYRFHSFNGKILRGGIKIPRIGFVPTSEWKPFSGLLHPWVRTWDCGWKIDSDEFPSTLQQRKLANAAVKALGLTFGAVDIGKKSNGDLKIIGVDKGPVVHGRTLELYVKAIKKWRDNVCENGRTGNGPAEQEPNL